MLFEAFEIALNGLADVGGRLRARLSLRDAAGERRAGCNKHAILIWLEINPIFHSPPYYQRAKEREKMERV
jgi:hypothetical protein